MLKFSCEEFKAEISEKEEQIKNYELQVILMKNLFTCKVT